MDATQDSTMQVVLSFDVDGETLWLSRDTAGATGPVMLSQGAYGPRTAVPRILKLLDEYDIRATFFTPGWIAERHGRMCEEILKKGHEIGHHGYLHEWPNRTDPEEERSTFVRGLEILERVTGRKPLGYRSPGWEFSDITLSLLIEHGLKYSSNMMDADAPYEHMLENRGTGLVELPVSWLLDDAAFFMFGLNTSGYAIQNARQVLEIWIDEFEGLHAESQQNIYTLTMHPQIIGRPSRMAILEKLIAHIRKKSKVVFATGLEAAEQYIRGRHI